MNIINKFFYQCFCQANFYGKRIGIIFFILILGSCTSNDKLLNMQELNAITSSDQTSRFLIGDCELMGNVTGFGKYAFQSPNRLIKTTGEDCAVRGGKYLIYDRANYKTSLQKWLPEAHNGDLQAQKYVGYIYEEFGDYNNAIAWYRKAAAQNFAPAQRALGYLYETGLGVRKNKIKALNLYRKASGLDGELFATSAEVTSQIVGNELEDISIIKAESKTLNNKLEKLQKELEKTQQDLKFREDEISKTKQELEDLRRGLNEKKSSSHQTDSHVAALKNELAERNEYLFKIKNEKSTIEVEMQTLKQTNLKLQNKVQTANEKMANFEKANSEFGIKLLKPGGALRLSIQNDRSRVFYIPQDTKHKQIVVKIIGYDQLDQFFFNDDKIAAVVPKNGIFNHTLEIKGDSKHIEILAVSKDGHHEELSLEFKRIRAKQTPVHNDPPIHLAKSDFGTYHALLIANKDYEYAEDLDTPINDVTELANILKTKYGFKNTIIENGTRDQILSEINQYRETLKENDNLVIYYAGHGLRNEEINKGYWLPTNGREENMTHWISNDDLRGQLKLMKSKHVLVISDSCFSGMLTRSSIPEQSNDMNKEERNKWLIENSKQGRSREVLSSGGVEPVVDGGTKGGKHSVFANALIDALVENTQILDLSTLYKKVKNSLDDPRVREITDQIPEYAPIKAGGHEKGLFFFVPEIITAAQKI